MLAVLSPAKNLDLTPAPISVETTQPVLMDHAAQLMKTTRNLSQKKIRELMNLSADLGKLNYDRYRSFALPFTDDNAQPAAFMFNGDVYRGLDARSLGEDDMDWAQDHVAILSGLYGLLRPKDLMQPYRLEMGTRLSTRRGKTLYSFWGDVITRGLNETVADHDDKTLVNLASNEYFRSVKPKALAGQLVTCLFEDWKKSKNEGTVISFMAKQARGAMARFIIQQRIDRAAGLKDFAHARYEFRKDRSSGDTFVFSRKFIPVAQQN
jgi:cytoplasmic iron level regulating protein YaaA (DUF328/UPF0246 family)